LPLTFFNNRTLIFSGRLFIITAHPCSG
jgi:hypothetical protein